MSLRRIHRRLAVLMGLAGLLAFAGGAGFEPVSAAVAGTALLTALWWQPDPRLSVKLERLWLRRAIQRNQWERTSDDVDQRAIVAKHKYLVAFGVE